MFVVIIMCYVMLYFVYVFVGDGYFSGYYSYMWFEVMDVDVFVVFEEVGGVFDLEMVKLFEVNILLMGGLVDVGEFY